MTPEAPKSSGSQETKTVKSLPEGIYPKGVRTDLKKTLRHQTVPENIVPQDNLVVLDLTGGAGFGLVGIAAKFEEQIKNKKLKFICIYGDTGVSEIPAADKVVDTINEQRRYEVAIDLRKKYIANRDLVSFVNANWDEVVRGGQVTVDELVINLQRRVAAIHIGLMDTKLTFADLEYISNLLAWGGLMLVDGHSLRNYEEIKSSPTLKRVSSPGGYLALKKYW